MVTTLLFIIVLMAARSICQTAPLVNILEHQTPVNVTLGQTMINGVVTPLALTIDSIRVSNGGSTLFNVSAKLKMILGDAVLPTRLDTVLGTPPAGFPATTGSLIPLWVYITVANSTVPVHLDVNPATFLQAVTTNLLQSPPTLFGGTVGGNGGGGLASFLPPFLQPPQQPNGPSLSQQIGRNAFTGFPPLTNLVTGRQNNPQN